jgi:putative transposase
MKGKSKASKTQQDKDSTTLNHSCEAIQLELHASPLNGGNPRTGLAPQGAALGTEVSPLFVTAEFLPQSNVMTLIDKSSTCNPSTQTPWSSKILGQDSTLNAKVCAPYWNDFCEEISSRLLLPVETDCVGLDLNSYNIWSNKTVEKSWFSTKVYTVQIQNSRKIYSPSFTSFHAGCTDFKSTVKKSKKIYLKLSPKQKIVLKKWFGVSRFVYNETIRYLQQPNTKANWKEIKTGILHSLPDWCSEVPYQIKSIAIKDACTAVKNAKKKYKDGGGISKCRFRSRKDQIQSCYIPKSAVKDVGMYHTILGKVIYKEALPSSFGDCRLVLGYGDYYLCVPVESSRCSTENQGRVVALDPGIRTFLTFFGETSFGWLGNAANIKIQKLCFKLDKLISRISKAKCRQKKRLKIAATRLRGKMKCLVDELHKKTAKFLINNFDVILLPTFETSNMSRKAKRRIRAKSVRQMLTLSHYQLKLFIKHKAFENSKVVIDVNEAYTSKTVSWTGELVKKLGGSKIIKSLSTALKMDRDLNGARGIFLRALVDTPWLRDNLNLCIC